MGNQFSVLMSVYAAEKPPYLKMCFESLCAQTLPSSEVVLVEDGPIGCDLAEVIEQYREALNIRSIKLPTNAGLATALNAGLNHCSHDVVARMDTDDMCTPDRFDTQIPYMTSHPDLAVLGGQVEEFDQSLAHSQGFRKTPTSSEEVVRFAKKRSPVSHPTAIIRKSMILAVGGYPLFRKAQDYALWSRLLASGYQIANVPQVVLKMRTGSGLLQRRGVEYFRSEIDILKFQKSIGFITTSQFIFNLIGRAILRMAPGPLKATIYKLGRS